jgi:hypothetical protein
MTDRILRLKPRTPPGTPVWYQPIIGRSEQEWAGVTEGYPFKLGQRFAVHLFQMDPAYEYAATKGGRVVAACFAALRLRKVSDHSD